VNLLQGKVARNEDSSGGSNWQWSCLERGRRDRFHDQRGTLLIINKVDMIFENQNKL
jgi:hypothetical protein